VSDVVATFAVVVVRRLRTVFHVSAGCVMICVTQCGVVWVAATDQRSAPT